MNSFVNTFILGSAKCATTSLSHWLMQHPEVCLAKNKEPLFMSTNEYAKGLKHYHEKYFDHYHGERIVIDATTMHLVVPYVLNRIKMCSWEPKFIIMVRDPLERAFSHWRMQRHNYRPGYTFDTFEQAMEDNLKSFSYSKFSLERERMASFDGLYESYTPTFIEQGLFAHHSLRYIDNFGKHRVHFVLYDHIKEQPEKVYSDTCAFLGIGQFNPVYVHKKISKHSDKIKMDYDKVMEDKTIRKIFYDIFLPDVFKLSEIMSIDLKQLWWPTQ